MFYCQRNLVSCAYWEKKNKVMVSTMKKHQHLFRATHKRAFETARNFIDESILQNNEVQLLKDLNKLYLATSDDTGGQKYRNLNISSDKLYPKIQDQYREKIKLESGTQEKEILYLVHPWIMEISSGLKCPLKQAMHEKPYLLSSGILWKAQKDQGNIIFSSTFWLKKKTVSYLRKVQTKNFSVISKHGVPCYIKHHLIALLRTFLMNQLLSFYMFMTPGENLSPWTLIQVSYLSYIKKVIKKMVGYCKLQTHVLKFLRIDCKTQIQ